jgi:hypothetical protein
MVVKFIKEKDSGWNLIHNQSHTNLLQMSTFANPTHVNFSHSSFYFKNVRFTLFSVAGGAPCFWLVTKSVLETTVMATSLLLF